MLNLYLSLLGHTTTPYSLVAPELCFTLVLLGILVLDLVCPLAYVHLLVLLASRFLIVACGHATVLLQWSHTLYHTPVAYAFQTAVPVAWLTRAKILFSLVLLHLFLVRLCNHLQTNTLWVIGTPLEMVEGAKITQKKYLYVFALSFLRLQCLLLSNDFLLFFVCLEWYSLSALVLVNDTEAAEVQAPTVKVRLSDYLVINTLGSSLTLLGIVYLYGLTGMTHFDQLSLLFLTPVVSYTYLLALQCSLLLFVAGLWIKFGMAPFHLWVFKVYTTLSYHNLAYFLLVSKIAIFFIFFRMYDIFFCLQGFLNYVFLVAGVLNLVWGILLGYWQLELKSLFICSSIVNTGQFFFCLLPSTGIAHSAFFFNVAAYLVPMTGVFLLLSAGRLRWKHGYTLQTVRYITEVAHLPVAHRVVLFLLVLSVMGIPPFLGFLAKAYLLVHLYATSMPILVWSIQVCHLASLGFYMYLVKYLVLQERPPLFLHTSSMLHALSQPVDVLPHRIQVTSQAQEQAIQCYLQVAIASLVYLSIFGFLYMDLRLVALKGTLFAF